MTTLRTGCLIAALGLALTGLRGGDAAPVGIDNAGAPIWQAVEWPFPVDQWGTGQAFHCAPAACRVEVRFYLRAKVGFCNCATGVSDDGELDRVGDLELYSDRWSGLAAGHAIKVGAMNGRARPYRVERRYAPPLSALAIAFNDKCDVAVATVVADRAHLIEAERLAIEFLNGDRVLRWARAELGSDGI